MVVVPANPREARVWNHLNSAMLPFWQIRYWPEWIQTLALTLHKDNRQRYNYFFFLVANGLDPSLASEWTLMTDYVNGTILSNGYDNVAHHQVFVQMPVQHQTGQLYQGTKQMMNMVTGRVELF